MCENKSHEIFSAVMYKSLDYVFETTTSFKVMMNLLALPTPYLTGSCELYPHSGHLPEGTYRTPWVRGNAISTCKLFLNDSALDDLRTNNQQTINVPESYTVSLTGSREENEVIPSSNPDSLNELDLSNTSGIFTEPTDPCQETFLKMALTQIKPEKENKDLYLPEELVEVDYLKQFKSHLPSLKTKLSRLRTLPVADPLLSLHCNGISEDTQLRRCEPYSVRPHLLTRENLSSTISLEDFSKKPIHDKPLTLPDILETFTHEQKDGSGLSNIFNLLTTNLEQMNEKHPVLETIQKANQDIMEVEQYQPWTKEIVLKELANAESTEQLKSPADMEVDLCLSPVPKACHNSICLSTSTLTKEPLSPHGQISLVSRKCQSEFEDALWTAEKYPTFVVGFMLTEPQTYETSVDFQPFSEALMFLRSEKQWFFSDEPKTETETGVQQISLCNSGDFTESIRSDIVSSKADVEEFKKMLPEQDFLIPTSISMPRSLSNQMRSEEPNLKTWSEHIKSHKKEVKTHLQQAQNMNFDQAKNSNSNCLETVCNINSRPRLRVVDKQNNTGQAANKGLTQTFQQDLTLQKSSPKSVFESKLPTHKDVDPLSNFIMLRSQQAPPARASPSSAVSTDKTKQRPHSERPTAGQTQRLERMYLNATTSGNASREQSRVVSRRMSPPTSDPTDQHTQMGIQDTQVVAVQATESQYHAFCEVQSFAQPYLSFAQKLGLDIKIWGDFRGLTMDQTHFLTKQQEKALSRTTLLDVDMAKEKEQLQVQVTMIHNLVTFKELLLKCGLCVGVEFLKKTNVGDDKKFKQLLKRLQIILYLSQKKEETNPKLLELPRLLTTWFNNRRENNLAGKTLVLFTNNSDDTRSIILSYLHQVRGAAVADLDLDKDQMKLNGASVVSRMCHAECALVCEQHVGPDFPWHSFSFVLEYDHPGLSPWAAVCRERGLIHITFNTTVPDTDRFAWSLEDSVPYVLFVTEGLLNCPVLLSTLESAFNISVLERSHCTTLQKMGGTHQYALITVDESTVIVIQKQEELCQEQASETMVMRLTALSLQYSCCWLILYCPDSQGGGLSSEAFSNLILVYSSLVLFGMKSEDLDVKVLMVSDISEMAKWISQICFYSLVNSDRDPVDYMDREWLTILPTKEEKCLRHFPSINPLVSQLMLQRVPNFQWLLSASLSELKEMLPEVPHKVLKLFSDTTSLYTETTGLDPLQSPVETRENAQLNGSNSNFWIGSEASQHLSLSPVQDHRIQFAEHNGFCNAGSTEEPEPQLIFKLGTSSPDVYSQKKWTVRDLWQDDRDEMKASEWGSRLRAIGKTVERPDCGLPQHNSSVTISHSDHDGSFSAESTFSYNSVNTRGRQQSYNLTSPAKVREWVPGLNPCLGFPSGEGLTRAAARYGSKSFAGHERKRSGDAETLVGRPLTPLKKSKLSYEKVPGRSDGQTRLKLF